MYEVNNFIKFGNIKITQDVNNIRYKSKSGELLPHSFAVKKWDNYRIGN